MATRQAATNFMSSLVFVDTNVLIYARDRRNEEKRERARLWLHELTGRGLVRVDLQVLNELTRWLLATQAAFPLQKVKDEISALQVWGANPIDDDEIQMAWQIRASFGFQWFDCLLLAAAARLGCGFFLTEDMTHQAIFGPLTLVNPFRTGPSELFRPH